MWQTYAFFYKVFSNFVVRMYMLSLLNIIYYVFTIARCKYINTDVIYIERVDIQ